jgi:hypothetical protein
MALSTAHGASTLFSSEWNDAVFALKYLDSTVDHGRYSSVAAGTMFDVTSTAHGLTPVLTGESSKFLSSTGGYIALSSININPISSAVGGIAPLGTTYSSQFLTSTGGWAAPTTVNTNLISTGNLPTEMWKRYTTGTATTMFADLSTYVGTLATVTSWAYPLYEIQIPPWVQPSKVDLTVSVATCSTNTVSTSVLLITNWELRAGSNQPIDPKTTVTLSTKLAGVITSYFPATSAWVAFSTIISIVGGECLAFWALSTTAPIVKIKDIKLIGTTAAPIYPADVWTTACGTIVG